MKNSKPSLFSLHIPTMGGPVTDCTRTTNDKP